MANDGNDNKMANNGNAQWLPRCQQRSWPMGTWRHLTKSYLLIFKELCWLLPLSLQSLLDQSFSLLSLSLLVDMQNWEVTVCIVSQYYRAKAIRSQMASLHGLGAGQIIGNGPPQLRLPLDLATWNTRNQLVQSCSFGDMLDIWHSPCHVCDVHCDTDWSLLC